MFHTKRLNSGAMLCAALATPTFAQDAKPLSDQMILPNPMYGEWEGSIYSFNYGASQTDKSEMRRASLKYWNR
jgi:predicted secreted acid phosphatase